MRISKLIISLLAVFSVMFLVACGGSGGAKKSGVRTDGFFGALPAIYADYYLAMEALKEKRAESYLRLSKHQDMKRWKKEDEKFDLEQERLMNKLEADTKAAWAKIAGKEIPFVLDDGFEGFNLVSLKLAEEVGNFELICTDIKRFGWGGRFPAAGYAILGKDGSEIREMVQFVVLNEEGTHYFGGFNWTPELWVNFGKMKFMNYRF